MADVEFEQLLEYFDLVIGSDSAPVASDSFWKGYAGDLVYPHPPEPPAAANDNTVIWPVIPFPEGRAATR